MTFLRSAVLILLPGGALVAGGLWGCGASSAASFAGVGGASAATAVAVSAASSGSVGTSGTGGAAGAGLGGPCLTDTECGVGLQCLTPGATDPVFGGGAPNGFCTAYCSSNLDCAAFGGVCYSAVSGQAGRCTLSCSIGPALDGDAGTDGGADAGVGADAGSTKCLGRDDVRCVKVTEGVDDCVPTCSSDGQCPGRVCDPRAAVCVDPPASQGTPTGSPCDASALSDGGAYNPCAGACILFNQGYGMCSQPCVLGGATADECGSPTNGLCVFHPDSNGDGDTGYCTNACTTPSDCNNPLFGCFTVAAITPTSGRGYCFLATPCPNGDGDCASAPGFVCTSTPGGPECLDPAFLPPVPDGGLPDGDMDAGSADASPDDDAGPGDAGASDGDAGP